MSERAPVTVDETRCVGSGDCALVAPRAFEVDEDAGLARVLPGASRTDRTQLIRAAHACPTVAITVAEAP